MSNIEENSDKKKLIDSEKKTSKDKEINENILSPKHLNKNILNDSKDVINNKKIILNTPVNITVELGASKIKIKDFLSFSKGSMLILDKPIKDPLDIFINGHLIASGEIVVLEKKYGLRITSIKKSLKTINILS
ncbi:flagellar motor switch protein FliN [Buchnera aphidicola (Sitobion avenae)]|uniref:Flagellar motor switch protein FliN n=1 Tax=Buchnera aphidicola (Sitobion avenae) TaxID=571428 RepID=A0A4D6Y7U6_9GAMM|nr:flagellar motor switch protein FliN [Buchnera aphidicola]MCU4137130.1 flagellar motor switch protein FliN [Buchnera aphidicola (Sitobion miscanthi)]QCI25312.1 flagellar motor switch protein FliN [Buchnera aphidicola (Sitobion avenae)]